ncbi:MAG: septum formation initiator family protein [Bacteroidales bacterium]|nr:septum formation initiator family protein [Bacteroidales bacterium]
MSIFTKAKERFTELKSKSALVRIVTNKYFIATLVFVLLILFNSRTSLTQMLRSMSTIRSQRKQEMYYREAIKATDERIKQLTSNKDTLEMFARENYYFQEDGEDVYIVEKENK